MSHNTEHAEVIENLRNQIVAHIISDTLNEMNTIANLLDSTNGRVSIESDNEAPNDFIFYRLLQSQRYYKTRIHKRPNSSRTANDILAMREKLVREPGAGKKGAGSRDCCKKIL
jgi:hypothetical protein